MPRPGIEVTSRAERARRGAPTDTGVLFLAGPTSTTGTVGTPVKLERIADYADAGLGVRSGNATGTYDYLETFFAEGGATAYVLSTGTAITAAAITTALATAGRNLGPGQVAAVGHAAADVGTVHQALLDHAADRNRSALLDPAATTLTVTDLTTLATSTGTRNNADRGALFVGNVSIPAVAGSQTLRVVPPSALVAGLIARNDAAASVNDAPAGDRGYSRYAVDVAPTFTDTDRTTLNTNRVNVVRRGFDGVQLYGFRGAQSTSTDWQFFTNQRLRMALTARMEARAEQFLFRSIDGRGRLLGELRAVLLGELDREFQRGALFGETAADAYDVDVSPAVNTTTTLRNGEVYATVSARFSPYAELVRIDLIKAAVGGPAFV